MLKKLFSISEKEYGRFLILPIADGNFFRVSLLDLNKILNLDDKGEPIENYTRDLPPEKERNVTDPDYFDDIADGYYIYTTQTYDWDMDGRYGKFGIKDENGAIIVEEQYSDIYPSFAFGLCPVKNKDDKWGCVNKQGELVIPCSFYEPLLFSKYGIAEGEQGFVDVSGNYLEGIKYDCIDSYDEYDRYIKTAVLTPEQAESISDCGSAPGILEDIFDTKTRKYIAKGIPDGKISVYGDGDPETVVAAVDLLKEYDEVGVYDNCAIAIMGDERTVFRNEIDELYYMCIEIIDESHNGFPLKTAHNNPDDTNQITDLYAYLRFDPEGEDTYLSLHRDIYKNNDFSIDVDIEYFNKEKFRYKVSYFDLCYATAKAATKVIKERGFTGFHYDTESDRIDIQHFLNVKHLGIFKKPLSPYHDKDYHTKHTETASLDDEIELLMFDM